MNRGAFIVLEGIDKVGKTTQCINLSQELNCTMFRFPDRTLPSGQDIDKYLRREIELSDQNIHELYSKNRFEKVNEIEQILLSGKSIICDRYAPSGVAYTAAKEIDGLNVEWCKSTDEGLISPDLVIFMDSSVRNIESKETFGAERYEVPQFQKKVREYLCELLETPNNKFKMVKIDASRSQEINFEEMKTHILETQERVKTNEILHLW
eukprot:TRINITY_DN3000_c0_g1_i4.p1 TRINITY_DN3000_c0_g1~~TRINITY_DN3000_c0_g1_i4.p1  ORF type:complete len:209 (-),score=51.79 TRINITY_DN3000_c0_g1_i4:682-1308(-)